MKSILRAFFRKPTKGQFFRGLLKILLVLFVIGALVALLLPSYYLRRAKVSESTDLLSGLRVPAEEYYPEKEKLAPPEPMETDADSTLAQSALDTLPVSQEYAQIPLDMPMRDKGVELKKEDLDAFMANEPPAPPNESVWDDEVAAKPAPEIDAWGEAETRAASVPASPPAPPRQDLKNFVEGVRAEAPASPPAGLPDFPDSLQVYSDSGKRDPFTSPDTAQATWEEAGRSVGATRGLARRDLKEQRERVAKPKPAAKDFQRQIAQAGELQALPGGRLTSVSGLQNLLDERDRTGGLAFQAASGYWENTYVPGDPLLRHLQARLAQYPDARAYPLPARIWQPFDPPRDAALAVYLHADKTALRDDTRLLLQVGLQGTLRHSGRRPTMNVGLILDVRETLGENERAAVRALLKGFAEARRTGDRFSLTLAGRPGGTVLRADTFRHGPLQVQLAALAGADGGDGPLLNLPQAVEAALQSVRSHDRPNALLGSSVLIFVATRPLGGARAALEDLAYHSAVEGIPFSVVALGNRVEHTELERLTLMGQGNRRLLLEPEDAAGIVDKELHAVSHIVARALRLNIRLAPGVKLVEVQGSHRLGTRSQQRAKRAEQSLDQRLARNFGIRRDRGRDDEGIQILIPAYHAGDAHPILLDVVAAQPGLIAEVTLRYKDLVYLRNGTARAALYLDRRQRLAGPLEYNVLKNHLALQLAEAAREAGERLARNQVAAAAQRLQQYQMLLAQAREGVPAWQHDPELAQDDELLDKWLNALQGTAVRRPQSRMQLADALQYAGFVKLLPEPAEGR